MEEQTLFLDYNGLVHYDSKIKEYIGTSISTQHANDATVTDVQNLSGTTASIDINDFVDAVETVQSAGYVNAELQGSVVYITDKNNVTRSIDLFSTYNEQVYITTSSNVSNISTSNIVINIYYDDQITPSQTVTTDANGQVKVTIPSGTRYRVVFPSISGCKPIGDIIHTANLNQRSIEVTYFEINEDDIEQVTVLIKNTDGQNQSGILVTYEIEGQSYQQTTDNAGKITFNVEIGDDYTVTVPNREGLYIRGNVYSINQTADRANKIIIFTYRIFTSGVFVVTEDGNEYTLDQFKNAVESESLQKTDAYLIKVATQTLQENNGIFSVKISTIAEDTLVSRQWADNTSYTFRYIPSSGNSTSSDYYYDGKTATQLIQQEGDEQNIETPAADYALSQSIEINGIPYYGFLASYGQMSQFWAAKDSIDEIIFYLNQSWRKLSAVNAEKWTSAQGGAHPAYGWTTSAITNGKTNSRIVIPFFAY